MKSKCSGKYMLRFFGFELNLIMKILTFLFLALYFLNLPTSVHSVPSSIRVEDFGYTFRNTLSTVLVFYVELLNEGHAPVEVEVRNERCCLDIEGEDEECEAMRLTTKTATLQPLGSQDSTKNFEFMFHSMYIMNRRGVCTFYVTDLVHKHQEQIRISFNTAMRNSANCDSVDLDPERNCQPANCVLKYMGRRNFYNKNTLRCEAVAECMTLSPDRTEIIAFYDPGTNSCVGLDEGVGAAESAEEDESVFQDDLMNEH